MNSEWTKPRDEDKDALHILPLSIVPLKTPGLRRARLVKNARLKGVVELFSGGGSGSGQISPDELTKVFDLRRQGHESDLIMIKKLSELPSYDVYSLRVGLRKLGIDVDWHQDLRLSSEKAKHLTTYMRRFTGPLIKYIYSGGVIEIRDLSDLIGLFKSPDQEMARVNLIQLSKALNIKIDDLPKFLEDYGDVYLSLAYYKACLDDNMPKLVTREMVRQMRQGSVLVDIAIDQGGCFETSRGTTHDVPTYIEEGVVHYCVTNMPGAVARTSTIALNNATLPFALALADKGHRVALHEDPHLKDGLNVSEGKVTYKAVADAHGLPYVPPEEALGL